MEKALLYLIRNDLSVTENDRKGRETMVRDMTTGSINNHLIRFSIPLILGNLFQLTYNAVDSIIVGKFIGTEALAAVGTANPVMNIVILGITGICIGASVLMSSFFGAKEMDKLKRAVSTTMMLGIIFSVLIVIFGELCSEGILKLLHVPEDILPMATLYLRIIFWGMPFTFAYNAYSAAMRSVGDSKTPIKFLAMASVLNGCLDFIFIAILHMGVVGAAMATIIAECISALMCFIYVFRHVPILKLGMRDLKMDKQMLKLTIQNGAVTALQQSCQPIGKLLIQGSINSLGVNAIAVFNAVNRVDDFALTPEQSISHGMMTFVSQNRGAKKPERMKKGLTHGLTLEFCYWIFICIMIWLFREPIIRLFLDNDDAVSMGVKYLGLMALFYIFPGFTNGLQGYCRGLGNMTITLIATLIQITIRVIFVYFLVPVIGLPAVAYASMAGWSCMLLAEVPYVIKANKKQ